MSGRLLDHDKDSGISEYYHFDQSDGSFTIETVQDVTDLIELNKMRSNAATGRYGDLTLVASYPLTILMQLVKENILDTNFRVQDQKAYKRWLNAPENSVWRTKRGKL